MSAYENWRVEAALADQPDATLPTWSTDLTPYVDGPIHIIHGRPAEFGAAQPSTLSVTLNNADHRFTPGNTSSPYYPNWKQARRVRVRETIGPRTFELFSGWLELPDITDWAEQGADQFITVTAVDRLARLDRSRPFISTLAEYIIANGGSTLAAYYPMGESALPYLDVTANARTAMTATGYSQPTAPTTAEPKLTPAGGGRIPGDDLSLARLDVATGPNGSSVTVTATGYSIAATYGGGGGSTSINIASGQYLTIVAWIYPHFLDTDNATLLTCDVQEEVPAGATTLILGRITSTDGTYPRRWLAQAIGTLNLDLYGPLAVDGAPYPIAIQYSPAAATMEFWAGSERSNGVLTGAPAATNYLQSLTPADVGYVGGIGHVQIYVGSSSTWGRTQFLAQRDAGFGGLAYQTTGQRIRTLASYASVPTSELLVDDGVGYMSKASLAGKTPLQAMREAETTEQGLLLADGTGRLVFQGRTVRYNV